MKQAIVLAIGPVHDTMDDARYLQHCRQLWHDFATTLELRTRSLEEDEPLRQLAQGFCAVDRGEADIYEDGPGLIMRLFTHHTEFAPTLPRTLLWFLGSDCLQMLTDEEIEGFETLEARREAAAARGEILDWDAAARDVLPLA
jgi:hypothetical protein